MFGSFQCLDENSEKYITLTCRLKFIDSFRFMSTSLLNLISNLSDQHYNNCFDCKNLLNCMVFKDNKVVFRCFECTKNISKNYNNELTKRFTNTYQFCKNDNSKFSMLLRKVICPYE